MDEKRLRASPMIDAFGLHSKRQCGVGAAGRVACKHRRSLRHLLHLGDIAFAMQDHIAAGRDGRARCGSQASRTGLSSSHHHSSKGP